MTIISYKWLDDNREIIIEVEKTSGFWIWKKKEQFFIYSDSIDYFVVKDDNVTIIPLDDPFLRRVINMIKTIRAKDTVKGLGPLHLLMKDRF